MTNNMDKVQTTDDAIHERLETCVQGGDQDEERNESKHH